MSKLFTIIFLTLFTTIVFAEEAAVVVVPPAQKPAVKEIYSECSEFYRMDKSILYTAQFIGQGPSYGTKNIGATIGKYLDRNSLITLDFTKGYEAQHTSWFYSKYDVSTFSIGTSYKKFVSNSFYFRAGFDYKTIDYHHTYRDIFTDAIERENKFKGESLAASIYIGNQWQWENFTMGCDWVGYSLPVYSNIHDESSVGTTSYVGPMSDDQDVLLKSGTIMLLRFYLGASF